MGRKVYIEDPDVVASEQSSINVQFWATSYSVRVETDSEPLVLGPVECGHIDKQSCSWRFTKGKRLTLVLAKNMEKRYPTPTPTESSAAPAKADEESGGGLWSVIGMLLSFLPVIFSFYYFNVYKKQGGSSG